jgi:CheY-like chemotaxis protein
MRPADTIRASVPSDRQPDAPKSRCDCQGRAPYFNAHSIDHDGTKATTLAALVASGNRPSVLLLDSDPSHAEGLTHSLHAAAFAVTACSDIRSVLHNLSHCDFDILIVSSFRAGDWKTYVNQIQKIARKKRDTPRVVVLARVYRGPQERLDAERKGVRLVYER